MSAPQVIYWPSTIANLEAIAPEQVIGADHIMRILSNLPNMPNVPVNNSGVYEYSHITRTVSFTSTANLAAIQITITGLSQPIDGDGNPSEQLSIFSETIAGPNNETVETARIYKRIDSITTNADTGANTISAGFGTRGITDYIFIELNSTLPQWWAVQGQPFDATGVFNYRFWVSLTKPFVSGNPPGTVTPWPHPIPAFPLAAQEHNNPSYAPNLNATPTATILWTAISDDEILPPGPNGSLYVTFVQQGIT